MSVFEIVLALIVAAVVVFQAWLTRRVFKSQLYERKQKIWQAQLIWLLPIIGAGLVFTILQEDRQAEREQQGTQLKG
jgi:putative copper export protein